MPADRFAPLPRAARITVRYSRHDASPPPPITPGSLAARARSIPIIGNQERDPESRAMDQQDRPEVRLREARDIVAMLWHRAAPAGGLAHRGGVVRTEAVTARDVAAPCTAPCATIPAALSATPPTLREAAGGQELAGVLDSSA
ncbi:hypothetical protein Bpla01_68240 [Burkholderia plantarii]|nr:hypothetical protein Bpla01_68240 [Burkholderia plantarii]